MSAGASMRQLGAIREKARAADAISAVKFFLSISMGTRLLRRGDGRINHSHASLGLEIDASTCRIPGAGLPSMN